MSKEQKITTEDVKIPANDVETVRVEDEMEQSYIDYAMSVIAGRALPDVRDGLKPVQRRILYSMNQMGVGPSSAHRKSSSVVGETMGDYHPHGDSAIYDALARMSQDFSMRHPLVDGQGNFGSIDDDPPAAMRYTEARLSSIANELMRDIDKETVPFQPNYDDRTEEPEVFPAAFPNLLVNGASGIAVGMSTKIPPHNLREVIDATIHLIDNPDCEVEDLMQHIKGPDFPTGAKIVGTDGIEEAYKTGRGRIKMRASIDIDEEENQIIIREIPYQETKSRLIERIAQSIQDGRIEGVRDLRDESDRDGIRIVVELKRDTIPKLVRNKLLEHHLEKGFSVINLSLVDGQPRILDLKETLEEYVDHRSQVIRNRSQNELEESEERAHVLEGRLVALDNVDHVVETIRESDDREAAKEELMVHLDLTKEQVNHIVRMQLGSLTSMEEEDIRNEYKSVEQRIERLNEILESEQELLDVVKEELRDVRERYGNERRTEIVPDRTRMSQEDLIKQEDVYVILTESGYIKRMTQDTIKAQNRGGKGIIGIRPKDGDSVRQISCVNTHDTVLFFTTEGDVHKLRGYDIPEKTRQSRGTPIQQYLELGNDEGISAMCSVNDFDEACENDCDLLLMTSNGHVKRTTLDEFENIHSSGIRAVTLDEDDTVIDAHISCIEEGSIVTTTEEGRAIRFSISDVNRTGRSSRGVNAMELSEEDSIVGFECVQDIDGQYLLTVTENGYGKKTPLSEYRVQSRYGKGVLDIDTGIRNGNVADSTVTGEDDFLVLSTDRGKVLRTMAEQISSVSRNTKGVGIMETGDGDVESISSFPTQDG